MSVIIHEGYSPAGTFYSSINLESDTVPLLLIMGYGGSSELWPQAFLDDLTEFSSVIVFDNRGTGRSPKPADISSYSVSLFAHDVKELLEHLSIKKVNLLGYSLGGCIVLQFAHEYPTLANRLILLSSTGGGPLYHPGRKEDLDLLLRPPGDTMKEMFWNSYGALLSATTIRENESLLMAMSEKCCANPPAPGALSGHGKAFTEFDASQYITAITQPALVIHGIDDRIAPADNGHMLAQHLTNSQLLMLPDCEHCPHIEKRAQVVQSIARFLQPDITHGVYKQATAASNDAGKSSASEPIN